MEYEHNYASKGVGAAGLTTGIIGTALGVLSGGLGNIVGGWGANAATCNENMPVSRYELAQAQEIESLKSQIALRDSNTYTDSKLLDFYKYVDNKFAIVEGQLCEQRVYNATNNSVIGCIQGQVNQLMALTKMGIPIASICPQPAVATTTA